MNAKCWCCREPLGRCVCQDQDTDICAGCNRCTHHCRCKQLRSVNANRNRARRAAAPRVYIAGAGSSEQAPVARLRAMIELLDKLKQAGFAPCCPGLLDPLDAGRMQAADAVLLTGDGPRVALEIILAWQSGIPVFATVEELRKHFAASV